ncbi:MULTISPECIES: flagellar motor protein MotA [unclassified Xanthobacter]|uniref:flagellar motor protein MotA n=1 Tax=unclassified Xanthobacter TaxID=2623496 RepID=UPI001F36E97F|nr:MULTISPECIES: flagellar motor protein MotA [unclassified Xanthobacter]
MTRAVDPFLKLSSPRIFLVRMLVFLALCAALAAVLHRQIFAAFLNNPGLNGVIFGVLAIGIILAIRQVARLFPEVDWVNSFRLADPGLAVARTPTLLAPMAALLGDRIGRMAISQTTMRSILDSIGTRLDESRDMARYLTGLLVFLGLLGTFWGLLETVSSIGQVISALQVGPDSGSVFEDLKSGLAAPLGGMGLAFSSSLFGLAGSLVLGFLDLQAGQAQNRFYTDLEDWLSTTVRDLDRLPGPERPAEGGALLALPAPSADMEPLIGAINRLEKTMAEAGSQRVISAMSHLAESLQGLVTHLRSEQVLIKQLIDTHGRQQEDLRHLVERLEKISADAEQR